MAAENVNSSASVLLMISTWISSTTPVTKDISVGSHSNNGFVSKVIRYKGLAAHAAGAPHLGVNALNAASLGLSALAYQRETFRDDDHVRIHPIITKGGNLVNVVPDEVVIETLVRAANKDAIADAAAKTDRAFKAGAIAVGASCEIAHYARISSGSGVKKPMNQSWQPLDCRTNQ